MALSTQNITFERRQKLGAVLRELRLSKNLNLEDVAALVGLTTSTISKIERAGNRGEYKTSDDVLEKIAVALGKTLQDLESQVLGKVGILEEVSLCVEGTSAIEALQGSATPINICDKLVGVLDGIRNGSFLLGIVLTTANEYSPFEMCKVALLFNIIDIIVLRRRKDDIKNEKIVEAIINTILSRSNKNARYDPSNCMFYGEWILY